MRKINFNCSKSSCLFLALLFVAGTVQTQTKLGNNPKVVQAGSLLELESATKGLRLPRIALNDVSQWTLDGTAVSGMLIYNESGSVAKGIYYWNTTLSQWVRVVNTTELTTLTLGAPSATSYTNGGYISGNMLYLAYADAANPGLLSTTNQTFAGAKTFSTAPAITPFSTAGIVHNSGAGLLSSSLVADADVSATAAIAGTKISPNFGTQNVATTGTVSGSTLTGTTGLVAGTATGTTAGTLVIHDGTSGSSNTATIQAPSSITTSYALTLPSSVALVNGQVLTSATDGTLSWVTPTTYTAGSGLTLTGGAFSVNTSQNIATLSNLTSNGLIKTSGGTGALSIATSGTDYAPATSGSSILKGDGAGGFSAAVAGTDYQAILTNPVTATTATPTAGQLAVFGSTTDVVTPTTTLPTAAVPAFTGDVTNSAGSLATTVAKLQNTTLSIGTPANGDVLQYTTTGTKWVNTPLSSLGSITLAIGTTGTDVNFSASTVGLGGTMTLNIPDAGATSGTRGVVNTGAQTFYGAKTFNSNVSVGGTLGVTGNQTNTGNFSQTGATTFSTGTGAVSLNGATTAAGSLTVTGTAALNGNTTLATGKTLTLTGLNSSLLKTNASGVVSAAVAGTDYQMPITLTTTGTSGAATLSGNTLNIPQYAGSVYTAGTGLTLTGGAFSVNTSQNIATLSNLTSNGLIKTSGGIGALSIATSGTDYAPATSGSSILKGDGAGGFSAAVAGTDYQAILTNPVTATTATPTAGQLAVFGSTTDVVTPTTTLPTAAVPAFTGDVTNTAGSLATTVAKLQNTTLSIGTPANGDVLQYTTTGTKWVNTPLASLGSIALATQNAGSDVGFASTPVSLGGTLTLNVPDAGASARGVVNTTAQTFAGDKTFNSNVSVGGTLGVTGNQTNSGNFSQTGATTFSTGTGAISLNGTTTLAAGKSFTLSGATSGTLGFTLPATVTPYSLTWPAAVASANGQVLTSATDGTLSWATAGTYTADNGLTLTSNNIALGGSLTGATTIEQKTNTLAFTSTAATGTSHFTVDGTTLNVDAVNNRVGIGTATPGSRLEVNGAATNTSAYNAGSTTTIDFKQSNLAYTTASAGNFTLTGMKDGGTYTLAVQGTTSGTAAFSGTNPSSTAFTFKSVNNAATTAGNQTVYTFIVMGTTVYFWMNSGF